MKHSGDMIVAVALAVALCAPGAQGQVDAVVHAGHTANVRALHLTGSTLWIATGGGLFRYDVGMDEMVDHLIVGSVLPSSSVRALASKGDSVLAGTDAGLVIFDGESTHTFTNRSPAGYDSLVFDDIRSIDVGSRDRIFLGTYGHGLGVMDADDGRMITRRDSLLDNKVYGVVETFTRDEDGGRIPAYYYATSMGLCAWRDSVWVNFQAGAGIPRGEVRRLFPAAGAYYLLVGVGGVYRFNGSRAANLSPQGVLPADDIADMTVDSRGVIWAAGRFGGLAVYQSGNWRRIIEGDREVNNARWRCAYSAGGAVFFGSADGLVASVRDNILDTFRLPEQLPSGAVRSFVATDRGVHCLSGARVVSIDVGGDGIVVDESPPGIVALAADPGAVLWGAGRWGIHQRNESGYNEFVHDISAAEPSFTAIDFDANGYLWTATRAGAVYRYDGELWMRMSEPREHGGGAIDGLIARERHVWAFSSGAVARFDGRAWTSFPADTLGGAIVDVAVSPGGAVVAATASRLWLYREDGDDWQAVTVDAQDFVAPRSRAIHCIAFDDSGSVYLGTERGLGLIRPDGVRWIGPRDGIGGAAVIDAFVEDNRFLWLGFRSDGVTRIPLESLWNGSR